MLEDILDRFRDKKKSPEIVERYKNILSNETSKYPKSFELYGAKVSIRGGRPSYDWSVCNDPKLVELTEKFEIAKDELEARQEMLKNIPSTGVVVTDPDSGETTQIFPPAKAQPDQIVVTLK